MALSPWQMGPLWDMSSLLISTGSHITQLRTLKTNKSGIKGWWWGEFPLVNSTEKLWIQRDFWSAWMLLKIHQIASFFPFWGRSSLVSRSQVFRQTEHTQWDVSWFSQVSFQETWGCRWFFFTPSPFWFEIMKHALKAIWNSVFKRGKIHEAEQMPVNLYSCTKFDLVKGCGGGTNLPYACGAFSSWLSCLRQENLLDRWRDLCQRLNIFVFSNPCLKFTNSPKIN